MAAGTVTKQRLTIDSDGRSAEAPAFQAGAAHAGTNPFDDQVPLQLGDGADDHDQSAVSE